MGRIEAEVQLSSQFVKILRNWEEERGRATLPNVLGDDTRNISHLTPDSEALPTRGLVYHHLGWGGCGQGRSGRRGRLGRGSLGPLVLPRASDDRRPDHARLQARGGSVRRFQG